MLKVEKPEKVVWGSSKSFLALFLENLHKKKFFEPSCREGAIPTIRRVRGHNALVIFLDALVKF